MASPTGLGEYIRMEVSMGPSLEKDNPEDVWYALATVVGSFVLGLGTLFAIEAYQSSTRPKCLQVDENNFKKFNIDTRDLRITNLPAQHFSLLELDIPDLKRYFVVFNDRGNILCSDLLYEDNYGVMTGYLKEYNFTWVRSTNRLVVPTKKFVVDSNS